MMRFVLPERAPVSPNNSGRRDQDRRLVVCDQDACNVTNHRLAVPSFLCIQMRPAKSTGWSCVCDLGSLARADLRLLITTLRGWEVRLASIFIIIYADLTMNSLLLIYLFYYYLFSQARNNRALMRYINSGAKSPVTYSVAAETRSTPRRRSNIPLYAFWMHIAAFS